MTKHYPPTPDYMRNVLSQAQWEEECDARAKRRQEREEKPRPNGNGRAAPPDVRIVDIKAPFAVARLFLESYCHCSGLRTINHHRGAFYRWNGRAYLESVDGELRAEIYPFLDQSFSKGKKDKLIPVNPNSMMVSNVLDSLRAAAHLDGTISAPPTVNRPRKSSLAKTAFYICRQAR